MREVFILACFIASVVCFPERRFFNSACNSICPMYVVEFCGSDGKTYTSNPCFVKSQWCNEGRNDYNSFHTLHMGACLGNELTPTPTTPTTTATIV